MKIKTILTLVALLGLNFGAHANPGRTKQLTPDEKAQIAEAIRTLGRTKTLTLTGPQCMEFDKDILNVLEQEGYLKPGDVEIQTFCPGV